MWGSPEYQFEILTHVRGIVNEALSQVLPTLALQEEMQKKPKDIILKEYICKKTE